MKKQSYVPTTLGQYLNENRSITLTRKYGGKSPVVVGSRAPLRSKVLSFVSENAKVSRVNLKRFIAGLNETSKNPAAAANMWLKRNARFFITESKGGVTSFKLSKLGEKLMSMTQSTAVGTLSEERLVEKKKDHDFKDKKTGEKGITDEDVDEDGNCVKEEESREERVSRIVEQIKAKRAASEKLLEEEAADEDEEVDDDAEEDTKDEEVDDDAEENAEEDDDAEGDDDLPDFGDDDAEGDDEAPVEDDDRVEITEFIITVDDVNSAIEELGELGIEASPADAEVIAEPEGDDFDLGGEEDFDLGDEDLEGGDDLGGEESVEDFDLDLGGELEGEEEAIGDDVPEVEESVTGMEGFEKSRNAKYKASPPNLTEDDDDFTMDDLEDFGGEEEAAEEVLPEDVPEVEGDEDLDLGGEEDFDLGDEAPVEGGEQQIKVDASNWDVLKGWLEGKGVDIEEMFGGEIEVEGEESVEDEISFDGLEDAGEEVDADAGEEDAEDVEDVEDVEVDDDEEEVEESVTGMEKFEKKRDKEAGAKPANLTK